MLYFGICQRQEPWKSARTEAEQVKELPRPAPFISSLQILFEEEEEETTTKTKQKNKLPVYIEREDGLSRLLGCFFFLFFVFLLWFEIYN